MEAVNLEYALKSALKNREFFITYQPIFNLTTKKCIGMEALIRWQHPEYGAVSPDIFIPIAEKNNLIFGIGQWVIQEVCKQTQQWLQQGHRDFKLFINISPKQLLQENFARETIQIISDMQIPAHYIEFELTETSLMPYNVSFKKALDDMFSHGISITIDDFGTGYSSLVHLRNLPIQAFKIDKSFVFDIQNDAKNAVIVSTLIRLGTDLGLIVIAEGIETELQLNYLVENSCPLGQGHFLSPPLSSEEMTIFLQKR